jgi:hypothetical protein
MAGYFFGVLYIFLACGEILELKCTEKIQNPGVVNGKTRHKSL